MVAHRLRWPRRWETRTIVLELDSGGLRCRVIWRNEERIGVRFIDFKDKPKTAI
jgi:hypothetical protein